VLIKLIQNEEEENRSLCKSFYFFMEVWNPLCLLLFISCVFMFFIFWFHHHHTMH
jgi:hypothetical protein